MDIEEPGKKGSKSTKRGAQNYEEPPSPSAGEMRDTEQEQQLGSIRYELPPGEPGGGETGGPGASAASFEIDDRLLQIKREIETQLLQPAGRLEGVRAASAFQGTGNIVGVGVGVSSPPTTGPAGEVLSYAGEPGRQALNLYVVERTTPEQVQSALAVTMGVSAAATEEVPVNVIVTGIIDAFPHRFRMRPAPGGISVAHFRVTAGTIGCHAVGRTAPRNARLMILSNNHVLANSNNAAAGDCISQPGSADSGTCPADQIAVLEKFVPIDFSGGPNFVDCATGWCWPDRVRKELVHIVGGQPQFFRIGNVPVAPQLNMAVGKSGRTTQLTRGTVIDISASINVNYNGRVALFRDQIAIRGAAGTLFSSGGDSGSSIWTWDAARRPVGLLFAGGGGITFANKMTRVLTALDINLVT